MSDVLLPLSATSAELALEQATARVGDVPTPVRSMWNPDTCPAALLPWLAWAYSLDNWSPAWSEAQKRASIRQAVSVQRYKGTIGAVRDALGALGFDAKVREWFAVTPNIAPYLFDLLLTVDQIGINEDDQEKVLAVVDSTKNLRSHLNKVYLTVSSESTAYVGCVALMGIEMTIGPDDSGAPPPLLLDGTWTLDGTYTLDGTK